MLSSRLTQAVSAKRGMSLAEEGTSFRKILETTRRDKALELLGRGQNRVTEAVFLLGFSETSAFSRAFRRWFGVPPTEASSVSRADSPADS